MRYITIPKAVTLIEPNSGKPFQKLDPDGPSQAEMQKGATPVFIDEDPVDFYTYMLTKVLVDEKFNKDVDGWRATSKLKDLFADCEEGDIIGIEDEDWKIAADVAKKPSRQVYPNGMVGAQYLPLIEALAGTEGKEIPTKKPNKKKRALLKGKKKAAPQLEEPEEDEELMDDLVDEEIEEEEIEEE